MQRLARKREFEERRQEYKPFKIASPMEPTHHQHHNNQPQQQQQGNSNNPNSAAVFLQQLGGYGLLQLQQQQQQQASQLPIQPQFQIVSHQQQLQQQRLQFPMNSTMTATMSTSANHPGNIPRLQYPDRERQVKRRTKTGKCHIMNLH